jgi:hypothetical protein
MAIDIVAASHRHDLSTFRLSEIQSDNLWASPEKLTLKVGQTIAGLPCWKKWPIGDFQDFPIKSLPEGSSHHFTLKT